MNISNVVYPYPVLSDYNTDYINSKFDVDYQLISKGFQTQSVLVEFKLKNKTIEEMIARGDLSYVLHIECPRTSYRKLIKLKKDKVRTEVNIDDTIMRGILEISGFIVSNYNIDEYCNSDINPEIYGDFYTIKYIEEGSIIAATLTQVIDIKTNKNEFQQISSIIKVGWSNERLMTVDMDGEIIIVKMPRAEYEQYVTLSNKSCPDVVMTSTILPALVYVLDAMGEGRVDEELLWHKTIQKKLEIKNIGVDDINESHSSLELAQLILESPIERALKQLEEEIDRVD